ncbi:Flagellar basal-body rod protein FlgG [Phycisphaerae bacterium RAS2]|nr:Flagellar basal-body rod protein FlgG [Phycisphaerae bacterium RAS2]
MVQGLWQSAGGMLAQDYRQTLLANNLANAETPGFKPQRVGFMERLNAARARGDLPSLQGPWANLTGGVFETQIYTDFTEGPIAPSESPFDVAIRGEGFLSVQTADGPRYTRDGRMVMDQGGMLRHVASNAPVLSTEGRPIVVNPLSTDKARIDATGRVWQGENIAGRLDVVEFADRQGLVAQGENLFEAGGQSARSSRAEVVSRAYEASSVQPTAALVEMIAASRAYQMNATMISMQDQSLGRVVNDLGRIG